MGRSKAKESKAGSISIFKQQNYYINQEGNAETNTTVKQLGLQLSLPVLMKLNYGRSVIILLLAFNSTNTWRLLGKNLEKVLPWDVSLHSSINRF